MGRIDRETASIAGALFSGVQQRVLSLIFSHPDRSFYTSEIVRTVRSGTGAVGRELDRLQRSGLINVERIGNQKHYRANKDSPIFQELSGIVRKTVGLAEPLRQALAPHSDKIKAAFIYGSVAGGSDTARSDVDVMVVGEHVSYPQLYAALQDAERVVGRPVNPNLLSPAEWSRKLTQKNSVISKINAQPKIFLVGSDDDLQRGR